MLGVLASAIRAAVGHRAVAVAVIPGDVALRGIESTHSADRSLSLQQSTVVLSEPDLDELAQMLNGSSRTTLLCGQGCAGAPDALLRLPDMLKSPMVHALGGKEYMSSTTTRSILA